MHGVVLAARSADDLSEVCELLTVDGHTATAMFLDVGKLADVKSCLGNDGLFDILINNAGVNRPGPMVAGLPDDIARTHLLV